MRTQAYQAIKKGFDAYQGFRTRVQWGRDERNRMGADGGEGGRIARRRCVAWTRLGGRGMGGGNEETKMDERVKYVHNG